jgi:tRNA(His) 5'-end guanylyltransferase
MDHAARDLMEEYPDIILAFGESDEFRLVLLVRIFLAWRFGDDF